jgi:hypothetical protein
VSGNSIWDLPDCPRTGVRGGRYRVAIYGPNAPRYTTGPAAELRCGISLQQQLDALRVRFHGNFTEC